MNQWRRRSDWSFLVFLAKSDFFESFYITIIEFKIRHLTWKILWTSLSPDHKVELSSKSVNFFDRLDSFIAFSRLFSCKMVLFLIFLFNDNREKIQDFEWKVAASHTQNLANCEFSLRKRRNWICQNQSKAQRMIERMIFASGRGSLNMESWVKRTGISLCICLKGVNEQGGEGVDDSSS